MARANAEEDQGSHSKALGHYQRAIEELLAVKTIEPKLFSPGSELHGLAQQLLAQTEALPEAQEAPELNDDYRSEWSEAQQHEQEVRLFYDLHTIHEVEEGSSITAEESDSEIDLSPLAQADISPPRTPPRTPARHSRDENGSARESHESEDMELILARADAEHTADKVITAAASALHEEALADAKRQLRAANEKMRHYTRTCDELKEKLASEVKSHSETRNAFEELRDEMNALRRLSSSAEVERTQQDRDNGPQLASHTQVADLTFTLLKEHESLEFLSGEVKQLKQDLQKASERSRRTDALEAQVSILKTHLEESTRQHLEQSKTMSVDLNHAKLRASEAERTLSDMKNSLSVPSGVDVKSLQPPAAAAHQNDIPVAVFVQGRSLAPFKTRCARDLPVSWLLSESMRFFGPEAVDIVGLRLPNAIEPWDLAADLQDCLQPNAHLPGDESEAVVDLIGLVAQTHDHTAPIGIARKSVKKQTLELKQVGNEARLVSWKWAVEDHDVGFSVTFYPTSSRDERHISPVVDYHRCAGTRFLLFLS